MNISINNINFEKHNFLSRVVRIPLLWFLGILPTRMSRRLFVFLSGNVTKQVSRWAKSYKALEMIYAFPGKRKRRQASTKDIFCDVFLKNAGAVRNRLKLTKRLLKTLIIERSKENNPVRILSLGSGSGRSLVETIATLDGEISIKATLFDRSRGAINFSQELAKKIVNNGKLDDFQWVCDKVENLQSFLKNYSPDIIEMTGLLDYFDDSEAKKLFRLIYQHLSSSGWIIVSNVIPNPEAPFVTKGIKWPLIYRTSIQLENLLIKSGFSEEEINLFVEPLRIYTVAVCEKI